DHAMHLLQLLHQVLFGMQPAGGVQEQIVSLARLRGRNRVMRHSRGIGTVSSGYDLDLQSLPPEFQLLNGSGPKSITGTQQCNFPTQPDQMLQFGRRRGLPRSVDTYD